MYSTLLTILVLPLLALAQTSTPTSNNNNTQTANAGTATPAPATNGTATPAAGTPQNSTVVFTSLSTSVGFGPGRVVTTSVVTQLSTSIFPIPTAGNSTTTNGTATNGTAASNTTTTTTTPLNLPTAPTSVDGGGSGGAPSPGAGGNNGAFGPDDNYIAAATALAQKALAVTLAASLTGGALVVL